MSTKTLIITALIVICFSSCIKNKRRDHAVKIVAEWKGKEIKFPKGLSCTSMGRDTTCVDLLSDNYKILLYVDSVGCTSCRLNLYQWKRLINESDSIFTGKPEFVFFFQPKKRDEKELQIIFRNNGFSHPVFIDKENEIMKLNNFPSNREYQCFLLDKENKVILIGNPSIVSGIWILYKRAIIESETRFDSPPSQFDFMYVYPSTIQPKNQYDHETEN